MTMTEEEIKNKVIDQFHRSFTNGSHSFFLNPNEPVLYFLAHDNGGCSQLFEADLRTSTSLKEDIQWSPLIKQSTDDTNKRNLTKEEKLLQERMRVFDKGVSSFTPVSSINKLVVPSVGCLDLLDVSSPDSIKHDIVWHDISEARMDCKISPDGKLVAFVLNGDLCCLPVGSDTPNKLTNFHEKNKNIIAGTSGFILQEEFDQYSGFWWSPVVDKTSDGNVYRILYTIEDETDIEEYSIPSEDGVSVDVYKYARTGTKNSTISTRIVTIFTSSSDEKPNILKVINSAAVDQTFGGRFSDVEYIVRSGWTADGNQVWLQLLDRRQQHLKLVILDVSAYVPEGSVPDMKSLTVVVEESSKFWINVTDTCCGLNDGSFLWESEETGFRQLYLLSPADGINRHGKWIKKQITAPSAENPELIVSGDTSEFVVDEKYKIIFFVASLTTPLRRHVCAVSYAPGADPTRVVRITPAEYHVHSFTAHCYSPSECIVAASLSNATMAQPLVHIASVNTSLDKIMISGKLRPAVLKESKLKAEDAVVPQFFSLKSTRHGETLYGMVFLPKNQGDAKIPVVVEIYGGPHVQQVLDATTSKFYQKRQLLVELGYAVVVVDNVGSSNRGMKFESYIREKMGSVEIADQVEGLEYAAKLYNLDLKRVGLMGWSYGGYMALLGLAQRPDVFRFSFAGAPVTTWEAYDTGYTERYMGIPITEREAYDASSVLNYAERFPREPGRLFIVHGQQDENVHFEHTKSLTDRFDALNIPYKLHTVPGEHHGVRTFDKMVEMFVLFIKLLTPIVPPNP